jgi:phosphopentomutase
MKRVFIIILDGVGIGELPDADAYGDQGSNTIVNLAGAVNGLEIPNLASLGLGRITRIAGVANNSAIRGAYGKMAEVSPGKDSTTGHWELAGLELEQPFPTYPDGFPAEVLNEFTRQTGLEILGNYAASGTEIIKDLGEEHVKTGKPIIYTSADSVFQIAAHEEVIPIDRLYEICKISREILRGEHQVARVIARPFVGSRRDDFSRTRNRKDFSVKPTGRTILNILQDNGIPTIGIGKINDLYAWDGLSTNIITKTNQQGMEKLDESLGEFPSGLIFANLVDFDMLWGHRNDPQGFKGGLEEFDRWLGPFLEKLSDDDVLFITADHGNDPTTPSTDHSREYVPILAYGADVQAGGEIGTRTSFADLHATVAEVFGVDKNKAGSSFWPEIRK